MVDTCCSNILKIWWEILLRVSLEIERDFQWWKNCEHRFRFGEVTDMSCVDSAVLFFFLGGGHVVYLSFEMMMMMMRVLTNTVNEWNKFSTRVNAVATVTANGVNMRQYARVHVPVPVASVHERHVVISLQQPLHAGCSQEPVTTEHQYTSVRHSTQQTCRQDRPKMTMCYSGNYETLS